MIMKIIAALQKLAPPVDYTKAPPGADKFLTLVSYLGWIGLAVAVGGFVVSGIMMIVKATSGSTHDGPMKGLAWTCAGSIVLGGASAWATTLGG